MQQTMKYFFTPLILQLWLCRNIMPALSDSVYTSKCLTLNALLMVASPQHKKVWRLMQLPEVNSSVAPAGKFKQTEMCQTRGQAGLERAEQLRFPSALSSSVAKLILRLRSPWGGSAKACPPAAAGNCLQCRGPWNFCGSPRKSTSTDCVCAQAKCDFTIQTLQVAASVDCLLLTLEWVVDRAR